MQPKRILVITAVCLATLFSLISLRQIVSATPQSPTLLYDSSLGTLPSDQSFEYQAINPTNMNPFNVQATQSYSATVTVLDTSSDTGDYAGYAVPTDTLLLTRATGYQLRFDLRIVSEDHSGNNNRAGFSVILLSEDLYGVEIAFWENEIWVQEGNGGSLFTQAEGTLFNTTNTLTTYDLTVISNTYLLTANGTPLLSGSLRQYTDWEPPVVPPPVGPLPDPYEQPNLIFLGDNTSSAGAEIWLGDVAIETEIAPTISVGQTAVSLTEALTQTTFNIDLDMASPLTTTVQYSLTSGTAVAGQDFVASSGTLTFTPGNLSENINLTLLPDELPEPNETFSLQLFNGVNGILGMDTAVFTIQDDDAANYVVFLPQIFKP